MKRTVKDILSYLEGNTKFYLDKFIGLSNHIQEQITWRLLICKEDCVKNQECEYCGCPPDRKAFTNESCNGGDRFPDLMGSIEWEEYKKQHNIVLDEQNI